MAAAGLEVVMSNNIDSGGQNDSLILGRFV